MFVLSILRLDPSWRCAIAIMAFVCCAGAPGGPVAKADPPVDAIRASENDGRNAAILLAASESDDIPSIISHGMQLRGQKKMSFHDVEKYTAQLGCATTLRKLTYAELVGMRRPAIVLLRENDNAQGEYCLVQYAGQDKVTVIHGGLLLISELSNNDFHRFWTGHALLPVRSTPLPAGAYLAALVVGAGVGGFIQVIKSHRKMPSLSTAIGSHADESPPM